MHLLRAKLYFVFGGGCIGLSSARRPTPLGVPTDMLSVVKKVRPIKPGDLKSPYPIDIRANAWLMGITYPQSIKRLGHFLTADNISAGTPNGGKGISGTMERLTEDRHIRRYGRYGSHVIRAAPLPACPVSDTPEGDRKDEFPAIVLALLSNSSLT